ncbi:MAG: winged helix-turn-helix domain-containing protein [Gammaproteobacteria bacterium]|nr:winged helix-turn-helix domain-containing protein [Gammaproteobacteria bacterium]
MEPTSFRCDRFEIDVADRRFLDDGREVALEPRVFAVIAQLLRKPGTLVARHELLDAVWGHRYVTPSTLNRTIALARRAFGDDVDDPRFIQTVHGAGYRYVGPIEPLAPRVAARFAPPPVARVPARIAPLIGRETELAAIADRLAESREVTVIGSGGMGKTQCALEAARRIAPEFPDGVWFFDLVDVPHGDAWLEAFASTLAVRSTLEESLLGKVCAVLESRRALVVLDNCDRISGQIGERVVRLLRATTDLKFLATSQEPLGFADERLLRMPPLALPPLGDGETADLDVVSRSPAVQMLITRIRAVAPDFDLAADNMGDVAEICRRLDGMPLALELAATRFALLSAKQVLDRLDQRFRFLGNDAAGRDRRHRSLLSLLEWSYTLLSVDEQRLLDRCSLFVRSWSMETAVSLGESLGHGGPETVDLLSGLVGRSLVAVIPNSSPPRYRLLETVREYAQARLRETAEESAARLAHLHAVVAMCRAAEADLRCERVADRLPQLVFDEGNIGAALATALSTPALRPAALAIVGSLTLYGKIHGNYTLYRHWCERVLAGNGSDETPDLARSLLGYAIVLMHMAVAQESVESLLPEAARIAARHGDWWCEGYAHGYFALALANWGRSHEAESHAAITERRYREHGDGLLGGLAGLARGWILLSRGEAADALAQLTTACGLGSDPHQHHFIRMYAGLAQFELGDRPAAASEWLRAMRLSSGVANLRGVAGSIEGCAYLACARREPVPAVRLLAAAQRIRERTEVPLFNFWREHHARTLAELRAMLSPESYAAEWTAGAALRQEEAAEVARTLLTRIATANGESAQRTANRADGS